MIKKIFLIVVLLVSLSSVGFANPLHIAARNGNVAVVEALLAADADVNALEWGNTPLHNAAIGGHVAVARALLASGADVNALDPVNHTPLHWAALEGHVAVVIFLLDEGADVNAQDQWAGKPVHLAARRGHLAVLRALLNKGSDINAKDQGGNTPLHYAAEYEEVAVVLALLEAGADLTIVNNGGHTAFELATPEVQAVIQQWQQQQEVLATPWLPIDLKSFPTHLPDPLMPDPLVPVYYAMRPFLSVAPFIRVFILGLRRLQNLSQEHNDSAIIAFLLTIIPVIHLDPAVIEQMLGGMSLGAGYLLHPWGQGPKDPDPDGGAAAAR